MTAAPRGGGAGGAEGNTRERDEGIDRAWKDQRYFRGTKTVGASSIILLTIRAVAIRDKGRPIARR